MRRSILLASTVAAFAFSPLTAPAAPAPFQLVFDGHHVVATTFSSPTGLSHVGTFTTNYAPCPSGSAKDTAETDQGVATRLFTCASGATFSANVWPQLAEHGGTGSWQIISGTGPLADLRGEGSFSSVLTSGDPNNFITVAFRSTWTGNVDLDATPPTLALAKDSTVRAKRPAGTYKLSLALALADNGGGPVTYTLTLVDPTTLMTLVRKNGSTTAGSVGWTFVLRPSTRARAVRLEVDASDTVGNQSTLKQTIAFKK